MRAEGRKHLRLPGYDYSTPGGYFLTFCTKNREKLLSEVLPVGGGVPDAPVLRLTAFGRAVETRIEAINRTYEHIEIEKYSIMPEHVHLIVLVKDGGAGSSGTPTPTETGAAGAVIPQLVSTLKRLTDRDCGTKLWQRGYYDHVLRSRQDYLRAWEYLEENPAKRTEYMSFTPFGEKET